MNENQHQACPSIEIYLIKNYKGGVHDVKSEHTNHPVNPDQGQLDWAQQLHRARQAEIKERNNPTSKLGKLGKLFKKKKKGDADTSTENALQKIENIKTEEEVKWQLITAN